MSYINQVGQAQASGLLGVAPAGFHDSDAKTAQQGPQTVVIAETLQMSAELSVRTLHLVEAILGVSMFPDENKTAAPPPQPTGILPALAQKAQESRQLIRRAHDAITLLETQLGLA